MEAQSSGLRIGAVGVYKKQSGQDKDKERGVVWRGRCKTLVCDLQTNESPLQCVTAGAAFVVHYKEHRRSVWSTMTAQWLVEHFILVHSLPSFQMCVLCLLICSGSRDL